jgi:hypothetical protein
MISPFSDKQEPENNLTRDLPVGCLIHLVQEIAGSDFENSKNPLRRVQRRKTKSGNDTAVSKTIAVDPVPKFLPTRPVFHRAKSSLHVPTSKSPE